MSTDTLPEVVPAADWLAALPDDADLSTLRLVQASSSRWSIQDDQGRKAGMPTLLRRHPHLGYPMLLWPVYAKRAKARRYLELLQQRADLPIDHF